jgi:hypothetical protein
MDGDSDVDKDWTRLTSPVIDLSGGEEAVVEFAFWYRNDRGDNANGDYFLVYLSDDGGASWVPADTIGPRAPLPVGWKTRTILVSEHVALTDSVRFRVQVADEPGGSLVEAAIDDFTVSYLSCEAERDGPAGALAAAQPVPGPSQIETVGPDGDDTGAGNVALRPNTPNPFYASTTISFTLPSPAEVTLAIVDPSGRVVRTLLNSETRGAGDHDVLWDGRDDMGVHTASGIYFYRLTTRGNVLSQKMILLK